MESLSDETPSLVIITATMFLFCKDNCELHPSLTDSTQCACDEHYDLFSTARTLFDNWKNSSMPVEESVPVFRDVLGNLTSFIQNVNPWTVTQGGGQVLRSGQEASRISVIRGGEQYYLTEAIDFLPDSCSPDWQHWCHQGIQAAALELDFKFDEYVLVSDGVAGSTTSVFAAGVEQIWKNRDRSMAETSVVTVAYGGTGFREDITLAGFPAAVEHVRMENPLLTRSAIVLLRILLSDYLEMDENAGFAEVLFNAQASYERTVAWPPYFADSLPYIPVVNYYDTFMGPGAIPLQYVKMAPDEYIPKVFTKTSFADLSTYSELPALYAEASRFFGGNDVSKKRKKDDDVMPKSESAAPEKENWEASMAFEDPSEDAFHSGQGRSLIKHGLVAWELA